MLNRDVLWVVFLITLGAYTYSSVRTITQNSWVRWTYVSLAVVFCLVLIYFLFFLRGRDQLDNNFGLLLLFAALIGWIFSLLIWSSIMLIDDARALLVFFARKSVSWITSFRNANTLPASDTILISRWVFLQWVAMGVSAVFYGVLWLGMTNRHNYRVHKRKLTIAGLPNDWKGLKILQLSDIHCGSFTNEEGVKKGVDLANAQGADIILFTGDLVNNRSSEFRKWKSIFARLTAPMGVYSVLGNHDYGDYISSWKSKEEKQANLNELKALQRSLGWMLLLNEHVLLEQPASEEKIALVGVENWSAKSAFPKYGNLTKALEGIPGEDTIKILLSHDPSHWEAEVLKHPSIKLTLSGHTHGMQFGFETPFFKWSPVQWVYKQWAGLYPHKEQFLYVNRGFGYIGYPGRVGILPEITVLELV